MVDAVSAVGLAIADVGVSHGIGIGAHTVTTKTPSGIQVITMNDETHDRILMESIAAQAKTIGLTVLQNEPDPQELQCRKCDIEMLLNEEDTSHEQEDGWYRKFEKKKKGNKYV